MGTSASHEALLRHLAWWGLRRFDSDAAYFEWQRETLSALDIQALHRLIDRKRAACSDSASDVAFYDQTAAPSMLAVLHSQRYEYYLAVGQQMAERIGSARSVVDFGCGIGLLTTYYALRFPDATFLGIDRSPASIDAARDHARRLHPPNVRFEVLDLERDVLQGSYDLILCSHALLQAEQDRGLPSLNWGTLERAQDSSAQAAFEQRTKLGIRLDRLSAALTPQGRMLVFEKTRQLARRIPLQRALAARGFTLVEDPLPIRYALVQEDVEDGPLYHLGRTTGQDPRGRLSIWNEAPEEAEVDELYRCGAAVASAVWNRLPGRIPSWEWRWKDPTLGALRAESGRCGVILEYLYVTVNGEGRGLLVRFWHEGTAFEVGFRRAVEISRRTGASIATLIDATWPATDPQEKPDEVPIYENHSLAAVEVWGALPDRVIHREQSFAGAAGEVAHVELGTMQSLAFVYFANTYDQKQIVLMERARLPLLDQYYNELVAGFGTTA